MRKSLLGLAVAALASAVVAQDAVQDKGTPRAPLTAEQKAELRKMRRERRLAESGGIIERKVAGKSALIVNAQSVVPMECLEEVARSIRELALVKVEAAAGDPSKSHRPTPEHPVVVSVVNDPASDATILVAPEQNWATLNVNLLLRDNPTKEVIASRVHKEVWRATAMAMGAANSMTQPCLLRQINTLRELDHTRSMLPSPQPLNNMIEVADKLGIVRVHRATYRKACQEGWAPPPTNDIQRAIWDKVHQIPDKPIKIEFDPKKDK